MTAPPSPPFDLERFVQAQDGVWSNVLAELRQGRKTSHWMWFVFPQLAQLGRSETARFYGLASLAEARAYMAHPVLGRRLLECVHVLLGLQDRSAHQVFGSPDDLKLCSCLTLFAQAAPEEAAFAQALAQYHEGRPDPLTLEILGREHRPH